jgi:hypothetical protein
MAPRGSSHFTDPASAKGIAHLSNMCPLPVLPVRATAPSAPGPTKSVGTGHGADAGSSGVGGARVRPHPSGAASGEAKTQTPQGDAA